MRFLQAHKGRVCALAYSADARWLATGGEDKKVRVWDACSGKEAAVLKGHKGCVYGLAFSPDGKLLASCGGRNQLRLWEPSAGKLVAELVGHTVMVADVIFSPDGRALISAAGSLFDAGFGGQVTVWNVKSRQPIWSESLPGGGWTTAIDSRFRWLAVGTGDHRIELRLQSGLWNPGTSDTVILDTGTAVRGIVFSPDGKKLASATGWGVQVWDVKARTLLHSLRGHTNVVWAVAFSRDGRRLVSVAEDSLTKIWAASTGAELQTYEWGIGKLRAVAFAPDGLTCAAGGDEAVVVWDCDET